MQRRHFLFLAPLIPSAFFAPRRLRAHRRQMPPPHNLADETNRLNELASNIHTVADARRFIDAIAELFADDLPPAWTTESFRDRLAHGEYLTVTNPDKRIPEEHLASVWNAFLSTINAPDEAHVSSAEIHYLRNNLFASGRQLWDRGYRNFWLLPSIMAVTPDGTLAPACRVVESLRLFYQFDRFPETVSGIREYLRAARERATQGTSTSDAPTQAQQKPSPSSVGRSYVLTARVEKNPIHDAEGEYIKDHGLSAFNTAVETMLNSLLAR